MRLGALGGVLLCSALSGCASIFTPGELPEVRYPETWIATMPHGGNVVSLVDWWSSFNDPLLVELIAFSQEVSPTVAAAKARMAIARTRVVTSEAALLPSIDADASTQKSKSVPDGKTAKTMWSRLFLGWEIDLSGKTSASIDAAQARRNLEEANWHESRVAVAADVATLYVNFRACMIRAEQLGVDASSREATAQLTESAMGAGFQSPSQAALARASAAQGKSTEIQQRAACDLLVKSLVELTGVSELRLRQRLAASSCAIPTPALIDVSEVPARALEQRPDVVSAWEGVLAGLADIRVAQADTLPSISLNGMIGRSKLDSGSGYTSDGRVFSWGPLAIHLPIFDGGSRQSIVESEFEKLEAAKSRFLSVLRKAVREVEGAFVELEAARVREPSLLVAANNYRYSFIAAEARQRGGLASMFELEDARRSDISAQLAITEHQLERVITLIGLYRSLGGGWPLPTDGSSLARIQ